MGVGAAGGKSSGSEGAILEARLESLRKERSERAPEIKKEEVISQPMAVAPPGDLPEVSSKPRRKNKKKRKKNKR